MDAGARTSVRSGVVRARWHGVERRMGRGVGRMSWRFERVEWENGVLRTEVHALGWGKWFVVGNLRRARRSPPTVGSAHQKR